MKFDNLPENTHFDGDRFEHFSWLRFFVWLGMFLWSGFCLLMIFSLLVGCTPKETIGKNYIDCRVRLEKSPQECAKNRASVSDFARHEYLVGAKKYKQCESGEYTCRDCVCSVEYTTNAPYSRSEFK